jgi:signal transduction histidine kinase
LEFLLEGALMLNLLTRKREQEEMKQEEWFSHEIHDGVCQYATAAQMAFNAFRHKQASSGDWSDFEMGMEFLNRANEELRRLVHGLRPIHLAAGDLQKAVKRLVQEIQAAGGPHIDLCCEVHADLIPEQVESAAFRIVQESLANACRHSKSKGIVIGLTQDDESLYIRVQDWGVGFDLETVPQGRYGLEGIRRRAKLLHGIATIRSKPGEGTLVTTTLPLRG